jgi:hypothetical protein
MLTQIMREMKRHENYPPVLLSKWVQGLHHSTQNPNIVYKSLQPKANITV